MSLAGVVWHFLERVIAAFLFLLLLPLLIICALLIWIRGGRTPFLAHRRVGLNGERFWMLKFRTMWKPSASPPNGKALLGLIDLATEAPVSAKLKLDPRVADGFARFLRRYSIDELPQLIHVISGTMSMVGPRPLTADELSSYYGDHASETLQLKPGLTGLWQVLGRSRLTYHQRRRLDLFLVRHQSVRFYLWILWRTAVQVPFGRDAW